MKWFYRNNVLSASPIQVFVDSIVTLGEEDDMWEQVKWFAGVVRTVVCMLFEWLVTA